MEFDSEMIIDTGAVLVAITITVGLIALSILGRPMDGLEVGFLTVVGFFYGGSLVKTASRRAQKGNADAVVDTIREIMSSHGQIGQSGTNDNGDK